MEELLKALWANTIEDMAKIVEMVSYRALQKIKTAIENDSLSDFECMEEIVRIFEGLGSSCGNRHDFG